MCMYVGCSRPTTPKMDTCLPVTHNKTIATCAISANKDIVMLEVTMDTVSLMAPGHQALQFAK